MNLILYYYLTSGLIMLLWFYYNFDFIGEEAENTIADITWNTGISRKSIKGILYTTAFIFGWIILLYEIVDRFVEMWRN